MSFLVESKTLNKKYTDKKMLVRDLIANKDELILLKKSALKKTDAFSCIFKDQNIFKSLGDQSRQLQLGDTIKAVINTTNILDSHEDVHLPGIWDKSVQEQNGKTYHLANHMMGFGTIVGYPKDVNIEVQRLPWVSLGKNYDGLTDALIFNTLMTDKTNKDVFMAYRDNEPVQHSIRMQYVNLSLAINDPEEKAYYSNWQQLRPLVANGEDADNLGYFWGISEAKISGEGSTVPFGSNPETPYQGFIPNNNADAKEDQQPSGSTHKEPLINTGSDIDLSEALKQIKFINF